jgi:hypothetical protein
MIHENLMKIDARLGAILEEWKKEYLRLSQLQKDDERTDDPEEKRVPLAIDSLTELNSIRAGGYEAIHRPFNLAAKSIRSQLQRELQELEREAKR